MRRLLIGQHPQRQDVPAAAAIASTAAHASTHSAAATPARRALLAAALLAGVLPGLRPGAAKAADRRIVSVGGALTEMLFALGAESELVGVDTTSLFPAAAQRLPRVGYARSLSAEGLLSLRPTLVLAGAEAGPPTVLRQLEAARVPLAQVEIGHSVAGLLAALARVGALAGRTEAAAALSARLRADLDHAAARLAALRAGGEAPRVLFVLSHAMNQVRISGRGTAAHAMIEAAGARNAFAEVQGYKPLTPEAAIAAAPEVILATDQGLAAAGGVDGLLRAPGLAATPAGRARRVVAQDALLLLGWGPRLPQALVALAEALHGSGGTR
jgi:iron complex transport system substrate-binding protein